jgi:hypothetical protein
MIAMRYTTTLGITVFRDQATRNDGGSASNHAFTSAFNAGNFAIGVAKNFSALNVGGNDAGWSLNTDSNPSTSSGFATQDRIDSPGGTYAAGVTYGGTTNWIMAAASYTEASGVSTNPDYAGVLAKVQRNH